MAKDRVCAIDGCRKSIVARGWCSQHYQRWKSNGDPLSLRTQQKNAAREWLETVATKYSGADCLTYPFRRRRDGYADFQHRGRKVLAHRFVCEIAHRPPGEGEECSHSCGNGHMGCVNPRHLRWDTRVGNMADKLVHGTHHRGTRSPNSKLTESDVLAIRGMAETASYREIGEKFGIAKNTARQIAVGARWGWLA